MSLKVSDILTIRKEVLEGKIVGVVKIENIYKDGTPEASPDWVLSRTCVLDDELNLLTFLKDKLMGKDNVGNILVIGDMGSGKSHLLLLAYHLFKNPAMANEWLKQLKDGFAIPPSSKASVIQVKEVEAAHEYLWDIIFASMGEDELVGKFSEHSPGMKELRNFLKKLGADKTPLLLILDEVEPWFNEISDQSIREKNRTFLEKISELANDGQFRFLLLTALRGEYDDPKRTMSRECHPINLTTHKRVKIIPYRLFEDARSKESVEHVVKGYAEEYKRYAADYNLLYADETTVLREMQDGYPFHPLMLHVLFRKYTSHPSYQNTRGLLYLLSAVVRDHADNRDMFLLSDADVQQYEDLIGMLDRRLVEKAITSIDDAERTKIAYGPQVVSALFYYSLVEAEAGATDVELLQSIFRPGLNPTELIHSTQLVSNTCTYVKKYDGRLLLGPENPESIVGNRASRVSMDEALGEIADVLDETVGRAKKVYLLEFPSEKIEDAKELKIVFTLKREDQDASLKSRLESLLKERRYPNVLVFLVPERGTDLTLDQELTKLAKKAVASRDLSKQPGDLSSEYRRILGEKRTSIRAKIIGEKWSVIRWVKIDDVFDMRPLPIEAGKLEWREINRKLKDELWNRQEAENLILRRVETEKQVRLRSCLEDFHSIRGHPLPLEDEWVYEVARKLCSNGQIGVEQRGKRYFREYVDTFDYETRLIHLSLIGPESEEEVPVVQTTTIRRRVPSRTVESEMEEPERELEKEGEGIPEMNGDVQTITLVDTEGRFVRVSSILNDVENKLQGVDLVDKVLVREPTVELTFKSHKLRNLSEQSSHFADIGIREVETNLKIRFTELKGRELLEWLRNAPNIDAVVRVSGKIGKNS